MFGQTGCAKTRFATSLWPIVLFCQDCRPLFDILDDGDGGITITEFCTNALHEVSLSYSLLLSHWAPTWDL